MPKIRRVTKAWCRDEINRLILLIEANPAIWKCTDGNYSDRKTRQNIYHYIAAELNTTPSEVSSKFHSLRVQYNREKGKINLRGSNAQSTWTYYRALSFLSLESKFASQPNMDRLVEVHRLHTQPSYESSSNANERDSNRFESSEPESIVEPAKGNDVLKNSDQNDIFCAYIGNELRSLSPGDQIQARRKILLALMNFEPADTSNNIFIKTEEF